MQRTDESSVSLRSALYTSSALFDSVYVHNNSASEKGPCVEATIVFSFGLCSARSCGVK